MAQLNPLQGSLTGGELSPTMATRVDLARYQNSLKLCRNFLVRHWGGIDNRPGTTYVNTVRDIANGARMVPFIFNNNQTYILEFGQNYIRFITNGVQTQQLISNCPNWSSTTTYSPGAWVKLAGVMYYAIASGKNHSPDVSPTFWSQQTAYEVYTPYNFADLALLKFTQSADVLTLTHNSYYPQQLSRITERNWTVTQFANTNGPFQPVNSDTTATVFCSATTGNVTLTASKAIFNANMVGAMFRIDEQYLSGVPPWEPDKQIATGAVNPFGLLRRSNGNVYSCGTTGTPGTGNEWRTGTLPPFWTTGTQMDGDGNAITAGATVYATKSGLLWTYLHSQYGVVMITGFTNSKIVTGYVIGYMPDSIVTGTQTLVTEYNSSIAVNTSTVALSPNVNDLNSSNYIVTLTFDDGTNNVIPPAQYYLTASGATLNFTTPKNSSGGVTNLLVQHITTGANLYSSNWYMGSWSTDAGFPSCCAYMADRLCFAGTSAEPQTLVMSGTSNYVDFGESNPIVDSDAVDITVNSRKINTIIELVPLNNLLIMTAGTAFALFPGQSGIIGPGSVSVKAQSDRGISTIRAHAIGDNNVVYVQARGFVVRDLEYSFKLNSYTGNDLTMFANHLTLGYTLVDSDYSEIPYSLMWFVRNDGVLLSMTYLKELQILAWARHDTTNGAFENVCVVPEGGEDVSYFVVRRVINGVTVRYIERLATRLVTDPINGIFLDASLSYNGVNATPTNNLRVTGGVHWDSTENLTMTYTVNPVGFAANMVGWQVLLVGADGMSQRFNVLGFTDISHLTVRAVGDVPASLHGINTANYSYMPSTFGGLTHLIGQTVGILGDGGAQTQAIVDNTGTVKMTIPAAVVNIGLPIQAQGQTLELSAAYNETVSGKSLRGANKTIPRIYLVVNQTRGIKAGTSFANLVDNADRWKEVMGEETTLYTGVLELQTESANDNSATVCFQIDDPVPVSILGIIPEVTIGQ